MSVHGVGPSVEFVPGPPSQSATTRTTPDSGLGGDDRAMRVPPPGFNMSHPMYAPPIAPGPAENYSNPPNDYKPYQGGTGTVYFNSDYNRVPLNRGQQSMPPNYPDENYGSPQAQGDYHSNPNPNGFGHGAPMSQPPSTAMLSQTASLHQQSGYYWENHAMNSTRQPLPPTTMPNNVPYEGDMVMASHQSQPYLAQHNFHQPPPVTPTSVYQQQQQHSFMLPNGQPGASPVMVQQIPVFLQHGYPQMVQNPTGMYPHQMYLPPVGAQLMVRPNGARGQEQQYLHHPALVQQYYPFPPPPMINPMTNGPVSGFPFNNRYKNGRRGGYGQYNGRHGRQTPNGSVPSESRSESVRSDMNVVNEGTEDVVDGISEMQIKESTIERESSPSDYKRQKPPKQLLQLASDVKPERTTASPPEKTESSSVDEKTTPVVEQEPAPSEPEPPKKGGKPATGCYHCKNKEKPDWHQHNLREHNKVVCEDAKKTMHCSLCQNVGGENAHTKASCPNKDRMGGHRQAPSSTPRDRSTESYQEVPRPRGLMDQATTAPYEKQYHGRGGNSQYRNYGSYNNRDRHGGYQRDGFRGGRGYSNRGQRSRGGSVHGKSDRGGAYHPTGSSGVA